MVGMDALAEIDLGRARVILRAARRSDVPALVSLIAADQLGATRDGVRDAADLAAYTAAFEAIDADPAHILVAGEIVGTMQLSFRSGLARRGALRAQPGFVASHEVNGRRVLAGGPDRLSFGGGDEIRAGPRGGESAWAEIETALADAAQENVLAPLVAARSATAVTGEARPAYVPAAEGAAGKT